MQTRQLRSMRRRVSSLLIFAGMFLFACGDDVSGPSAEDLDITLLAPTLRLAVGTSHQFTARVTRRQSGMPTQQEVVWTSNNLNVARVNGSGVVTAVNPGTATIEVAPRLQSSSSQQGGGSALIASAEIEVYVPVVSVSIAPAPAQVEAGRTLQLTATALDQSANPIANQPITWSSSNAGVATVSADGVLTGVTPGAATITASAGGVSGVVAVTVTRRVAQVSIVPAPVSVEAGGVVQVSATARDDSGAVMEGRTFAWTSSNPAVATVSAAGLISGVSAGTATITASTGGVNGTVAVTVRPTVASVTVLPASGTIAVGGTVQLSATARDGSGTVIPGQSIVWTTSNSAVATVSASGVVTGVGPGMVMMIASAGGVFGTATITVSSPISSITITPSPIVTVVGANVQLTPTVRDGTGAVVTGQTVTWTTSNANVASVSATGLVTGQGLGSAVITAAVGGISTTANVTVEAAAPSVASITISPNPASVQTGASLQLSPTARDGSGNIISGQSFTWNTSNPAVATVSASGVVTGVAAGSATIAATSGGVTGYAAVTVTSSAPAPTVATVNVTPATAGIQAGATVQLTPTARDGSGNIVSGRTFTWNSSNPAVATVSATGLVTGVAAGSATITATTGGISGTAAVTVASTQPTVATVAVTPSPASVQAGATVQLTATARDGSGNIIGGRTFAWISSNPAIATVSAAGVVTGVAAGNATITASTGGVNGTSAVTVTSAPPPTVATVTVTPSPASVTVGGSIQLTATARDAGGNIVAGQSFTWSSSSSGVASVSASGLVTGTAAGAATITATTGSVSGTSNVTVSGGTTGENRVIFWSDWRTATGNSINAVSDGGKWDIQSRSYDRTMNIISSAGLDFPSTNVYQVIGVADMEGWSMNRKTGMPIPAVGESRYYRWYIRVTLPDGLEDYNTHPIQDGVAGSQTNWMFIVINSSNSPSGNVPNGRFQPQFWASAAAYPNQRWFGPNLNKNQTYRFELHIHRATTTHFNMHVRIYDSSGSLVADDSGFRNYEVGATLGTNPLFPFTNVNTMDGLNSGNNGIAGAAPWPFTIGYQGAFAVCVDTWCGPFNGNY